MDEIKVLMVGNHPSVKGGITSVITQLLNFDWETRNVKMKFIPTYVEKNSIIKMLFFAFAYIKIWFSILFNKPDVVHIHMSYKGSFHRKYMIHKMCRRHKIPVIIHLHGSEFEKWYYESDEAMQQKIKRLLSESTAFIVLGNKWNDAIKGIEPQTNTIVVSNAVDIPEEMVQWDDELVNVLFLGVLIKRKGVDDLIDAVSALKNNNSLNNMHFIIAGTGKEEQELKEKSHTLQLDDTVTFAGWIDGERKKDLIRKCQIMVLPSYNEGLPISILEAISYGMPIIATNVGDISTAVTDGESGYLIKPGDVDGLSKALVNISENKERYMKMSEQSRRIAEELFSSNIFFDKIAECYTNARNNR